MRRRIPAMGLAITMALSIARCGSVAWLPADITLIGKIKECMSI